jgi:hypothetical protein
VGCLNLFPTTLVFSTHVSPVTTSGSGLLLGLLGLLLLALKLLRVSPEERVDHDIPSSSSLESTSEIEDLASKKVIDQSDGFLTSVIAWNGDVDVLERRVSVAESDARNVGVRSLLDGLAVSLGVSDNQKSWLHELASDLVGECTWGPSLSNGLSASVVGELHDSSGTERSLRADNNVLWVLNGGDNSSSNHQLFPSLTEMDDVDIVVTLLVDISLHSEVDISGTNVGLEID